ncbi:MAG: M14 family metallopeptidase [Rhodothermales bacterium]|nr:M14 family metallopeptidase [Rhodothermales bacterium]
MRFPRLLLAGMFLAFLPAAAAAQELPFGPDVPLDGVTGYDPAIPTPDEIIGHRIGEAHTTPPEVWMYFRAVDAASDRVVVREHARSYEGQPLIHAVVTTPQNHARLEQIRAANVRLSAEPEAVGDDALARMPAVVYQGYSIHGNEASGTEAAVLLLYHLAAGQGPGIDEILENTVVLLDPLFNPDGRDRFTDWANRNRGTVPVTDPQDREHVEPWPGGRTNHYWFDLNRDWLPAAHPESQGRLRVFHHWRPQVLTDHHEMGSNATFFFQPGVPSRTNPNTPQRNQDLTAEIATYHARILDRIGQPYYSEESFDDFYYGKGSTYPDINGAIGILFEQASSRALLRETDNGLLDYATSVRNQFATSLSTLEAVANMREQLLRHQRDFYREAGEVARREPVKGYVIGLDRGRTRAQLLAQTLQRHRIRVHELARDVDAGGETFRAGAAYVIPTDQPQGRLVKAVMERMTTFEDSIFYDISTWTLPLAYDLDYAELRRDVGGLAGAAIDSVRLDGGGVVGGRTSVGYLMPWGRYFAPRALYRLQEAGIRAVLLTEPFSALIEGQERRFGRGVLYLSTDQRDADAATVHDLVRQVAAENHVTIYAVDSGLTPSGPDLGTRGGGGVLEQPVIALLTGSGTSAYNAGEAWHLLSDRFQIPVTLLDVDNTGWADLSRYNTLVLAGGSYNGLDVEKVKGWVRSGGALVALDSGAEWAVRNGFVELESRPFDSDSLFREVSYADLSEARGAQVVGGAIFEARLDTTHPLAFGLDETIPVFVRNRDDIFDPSAEPGTNVAVLTDDPLLSGYLAEEQADRLSGSATLVADRMGRGRVILFMDNPNFRAFWYGTNALFLNAVFLGRAF